ncbi:hypothetical protein [Blastomonas sp.]|uniref:hypothetical protein n=1 Tax=Blastomonas sp. TaxID=1909299 RepID=UPI003592F660
MSSLEIVYIRNERIDGSERWNGSFAGAKELAERAVMADPDLRVEILAEGGSKLFELPKIMRGS